MLGVWVVGCDEDTKKPDLDWTGFGVFEGAALPSYAAEGVAT